MKKLFTHHETYIFLAIVLFSILIIAINPSFFTLENLFDLLKNYSITGIFALGMLFVIISGNIDLSFTAIATITGYTVAKMLLKFGDNLNISQIFFIAGFIGILLGMVNASIIHFFKIPSIITTIATANIFYGLLTVVSKGEWLYGFPTWFSDFNNIKIITLYTPSGVPYGLSIIAVIWIALILISWFILHYTILGRSIYAMGSNSASAQRAGFNLLGINLFVFSFMGLMAGIGSVIQILLVQADAPNSLVGKELDVIAAVVLGGASLTGGTGSVIGVILGVTLIAIMDNGMTLMHVPSQWFRVIVGFVILISIGVSSYRHKKSTQRHVITETD